MAEIVRVGGGGAVVSLWRREGGYGEVLKIAVPLILSTGSWSIQHFVDRMFLTWYSRDALAAASPAGMLYFTFASFFIGTASYVNTFVAQYSGAGHSRRVGPAVWQGIYFGLIAGLFLLGLIPVADRLFAWVGHAPAVRSLETAYFKILCIGGPTVAGAALSAFFSGRGETLTVMWVNFAAMALNIVLDYAWIFGKWGFPQGGIRGAAWATVVAHFFSTALFLVLMLRAEFRKIFNTLGGWRPEGDLFRRLLRFGVPTGVQFMLEILGFSLFIVLVGRLGTVALAATSITFNINSLAFLPMLGMGMAVSTPGGPLFGTGPGRPGRTKHLVGLSPVYGLYVDDGGRVRGVARTFYASFRVLCRSEDLYARAADGHRAAAVRGGLFRVRCDVYRVCRQYQGGRGYPVRDVGFDPAYLGVDGGSGVPGLCGLRMGALCGVGIYDRLYFPVRLCVFGTVPGREVEVDAGDRDEVGH